MEFNFTDGSLRASIRGMFYRTPSDEANAFAKPHRTSASAPVKTAMADAEAQHNPCAAGRVQRWFARVGAAMDRAEQQIMDGFKVPPHGG